jgi:hypothetical protein
MPPYSASQRGQDFEWAGGAAAHSRRGQVGGVCLSGPAAVLGAVPLKLHVCQRDFAVVKVVGEYPPPFDDAHTVYCQHPVHLETACGTAHLAVWSYLSPLIVPENLWIGTVNSAPVFLRPRGCGEQVSAQPGNEAILRWTTETPCAPVELAVADVSPGVVGWPCSDQ